MLSHHGLMNTPFSLLVVMTLLSLAPLLVIALTTFTRNIIVLSLLRQALGLQQTPPNLVLVVLSLFLALFVMLPTLQASYEHGLKPLLEGTLPVEKSALQSWVPLRDFLLRQTGEPELRLMHELSKTPLPVSPHELSPVRLIAAFLLSELKVAFQIGFVIFLPFLMIELMVASILMSLGMIMVPPASISLPLKIMLFLLIDGWGLIAQTLVSSVA